MSSVIRKRKSTTGKKFQGNGHSLRDRGGMPAAAPDSPTTAQNGTGMVWATLLVALVATLYVLDLKPDVFEELFYAWLGLPTGRLARHDVVTPEGSFPVLPADERRRDAVVEAFKFAWGAYERDAMGNDEYHPISRTGSDLVEGGGIGYMVIDAIDTMQIMGLKDEYARARQWIATTLDFDRRGLYSTFETTIRVLGGLLSAYHLSGNDELFLRKAEDIGERLLAAFEDSPHGLPKPYVDLKGRKGYHAKEYSGLVSVAEVGTLQLEFRYLSALTGNEEYWSVAKGVMDTLRRTKLPHGLASVFLSYDEGRYVPSSVSLGSRGDSFYEYLLKQYIHSNWTEATFQQDYNAAMNGAHEHLIRNSPGSNLLYTSELRPEEDGSGNISWRLIPKQDHLVCFLGGSLMLGAVNARALVRPVSRPPRKEEMTPEGWRDWQTGLELIRTCMNTHDTATGLSPEIVYFRVPNDGMDELENAPSDWYIRGAQPGVPPPYDARYMLRPETVESLFLAYRLTGDDSFREHGWNIFQAIEKHCRVQTGGYATVLNVDESPARLEDKMETFFLSETLKYLFLLFSDSSVLPIDEYVFNTEAHPLPILSP